MTEIEKRSCPIDHLVELRRRLIVSIASVGVAMIVALAFAKTFYQWLQIPLLSVLPRGSTFISVTPFEAILTYLKVALLAGLFIASPVLLYQIWRFVAPGLYAGERRWALIFVVVTTFFFAGGALFGYFVVFPLGFRFFVAALEGTGIRFLPQMGNYLGFVARLLLTFGLVFELPVILLILARLGVVSRPALARARRYVVVGAFLLAGILTPGPDVVSQLLLALPLLVLYELALILIRLLVRSPNAGSPS